MAQSARVTRQDVANRANTSVAVVSYVINNGPRNVRAETRDRVLSAIRELGYRANLAARSLRTQRTMAIGLIVPDASNPYFGALAREIEEAAFARGYALLLGNAMEEKERELAHVRALLDRQVDGVILAPSAGPTPWMDDLVRSPTASVILDRGLEEMPFPQVVVDNRSGACAAVQHLVGHGCQRIACIAGPRGIHPTDERVAGWRQAMDEAGLTPNAVDLHYGTFRQEDGYSTAMIMLGNGRRPDAVFATSDEQAIGVLSAAAQLGLRVPEDLAVFGFDGIEGGRFTVPPLSTVQQPLHDLATEAVDRVARQPGQPPAVADSIWLQTSLTLRRSCGCDWSGHQTLRA
ncbi:LacI family DNA-binding transcriptional regulator [Dactylosporangium sp. NPDC050588]|uniref:LacI family DNA-binding transcriptional regulator n=1 Tax=Dactylosporangium sp. NPDC050588 TaxID=3157211 RepID=UPI00340B8634